MKATLKCKLGDKVLEITGEGNETAIVQALSFWSTLPSKCGKCQSANIGLGSRPTKKGSYYFLSCNDCTATYTFHQRKPETGGGFYTMSSDVWEIYNGQEERSEPSNGNEGKAAGNDKVPF